MYFDAHCHWQDPRLASLDWDTLVAELQAQGWQEVVVNGTSSADWDAVTALSRRWPQLVRPAYGVHPWKVSAAEHHWEDDLRDQLAADPRASIGEVGLDKWVEGYDWPRQVEIFRTSLAIAAELDRPMTIHCLRAWGPLIDILQDGPLPRRFLIHSVGASCETIRELTTMGAFFSASGAFCDEERLKYQRALEVIPDDRLLLETDAPDMLPPAKWRQKTAYDPASSQAVTHPQDLRGVYAYVAATKGWDEATLQVKVAANFVAFFGA